MRPSHTPEARKLWREAHHEQIKAYNDKYNAEHREQSRARTHRYYITHKAQVAARYKKWVLLHRDEVNAYAAEYQRQEKCKKTVALWRQSPKGKESRTNAQRKRSALRRSINAVAPERVLSNDQWKNIVLLAAGKCYWCKKKANPITQDHVIPLSKGGFHVAENVVVSCVSCNCRKHTKIVTLF